MQSLLPTSSTVICWTLMCGLHVWEIFSGVPYKHQNQFIADWRIWLTYDTCQTSQCWILQTKVFLKSNSKSYRPFLLIQFSNKTFIWIFPLIFCDLMKNILEIKKLIFLFHFPYSSIEWSNRGKGILKSENQKSSIALNNEIFFSQIGKPNYQPIQTIISTLHFGPTFWF